MGFSTTGFDFFEMTSPNLELAAAFIGLFVGSFLNVLALRSLANESLISPFSHCRKCKHRLGILDLVPILSYALLGGRCRYCKEKISWHYPVVEAATAGLFAVIVHHFADLSFDGAPERGIVTIALLFFTSVLIAVTVTDFREKLIPHEITYPSILIGLAFSFWVRHDLAGALAGVGISYILFDFIAFYGLIVYLWLHPELKETESDLSQNAEDIDEEIDKNFGIVRKTPQDGTSSELLDEGDEPFEVMGGGDAVLSAVLAAWLGWEKLIAALIVGFMIGAIMGAFYLVHELVKQGRFNQVAKPGPSRFSHCRGRFCSGPLVFLPECSSKLR